MGSLLVQVEGRRNGIAPTRKKRIASAQPADCQQTSSQESKPLNGLAGIKGTRGAEPALTGQKVRRDGTLIIKNQAAGQFTRSALQLTEEKHEGYILRHCNLNLYRINYYQAF
jgi:hypothetical protein